MARGDLAVVEGWLQSVNSADRSGVLALTSPDVEIVGPRGIGRGHELLSDWLGRAGFTSEAPPMVLRSGRQDRRRAGRDVEGS
jgi:hypothetical protein